VKNSIFLYKLCSARKVIKEISHDRHLNREDAKGKRNTRKSNPYLNPPLKRRAIIVCPFKGAFDNSPAFQGWEKNFAEFDFFRVFVI